MTTVDFQTWVANNQTLVLIGILLLSLLLFILTRSVLAHGLIYLSQRTESKYDDILVKHLRPYRVAIMAPFLTIYALSYLLPAQRLILQKISLFVFLWLAVFTLNSLLNALNIIYESSSSYNGVSIQGYLDIAKIMVVMIGVIISTTIITDESPVVLLTSLGALTAVLLLIFQSTLLSLVASIQIVANDLIKEGDWIEVPDYGADGDVINISLHTIKIQNFDMTYTVIPTYKILDVAYKNWRGMTQSGGRRIQRSLSVDMTSIKFCDETLLQKLGKIDLIQNYLQGKTENILPYAREHADHYDSPLDGPQLTNVEIFRAYIIAYLRGRTDIHQEKMPFLVRALSPRPNGLPIEVYIFARTTNWAEYEQTQAEIFDHLLAAAAYFDLHVFQEPTGLDFSSVARSLAATNG